MRESFEVTAGAGGRLTECLNLHRSGWGRDRQPLLIGVLLGEGIGPEVVGAALEVLDSATKCAELRTNIVYGGPIGRRAEQILKTPLSDEVVQFCENIFTRG